MGNTAKAITIGTYFTYFWQVKYGQMNLGKKIKVPSHTAPSMRFDNHPYYDVISNAGFLLKEWLKTIEIGLWCF